MKKKETVKSKLREKIYDLVYDSDVHVDQTECYCYDSDRCGSSCFEVKGLSLLYDKLIKLLEKSGINLDKEV